MKKILCAIAFVMAGIPSFAGRFKVFPENSCSKQIVAGICGAVEHWGGFGDGKVFQLCDGSIHSTVDILQCQKAFLTFISLVNASAVLDFIGIVLDECGIIKKYRPQRCNVEILVDEGMIEKEYFLCCCPCSLRFYIPCTVLKSLIFSAVVGVPPLKRSADHDEILSISLQSPLVPRIEVLS